MEKINKNEELQSRREFFKKAAKGALPILAAVALASAPNIIQATEIGPMGCKTGGCIGVCYSSCEGKCDGACKWGCTSCRGNCQGTCKATCSGKCTSSNKY